MGAFVLASANIQNSDVIHHVCLPEFRKASRAMVFTHLAVQGLWDVVSGVTSMLGPDQCGVVVGTSQGELAATVDFLDGLANSNVARPIIFQNSLHNSTLGYLSSRFALAGPSLTISNGFVSGEDALSTSMLMLEQNLALASVVVGYDLLVERLEGVRDCFYPYSLRRGEGASALLLVSEQGLRRLKSAVPIAYLNEVTVKRTRRTLNDAELRAHFDESHYEADGLAALVSRLKQLQGKSPLQLLKPDGSEVIISFERL